MKADYLGLFLIETFCSEVAGTSVNQGFGKQGVNTHYYKQTRAPSLNMTPVVFIFIENGSDWLRLVEDEAFV